MKIKDPRELLKILLVIGIILNIIIPVIILNISKGLSSVFGFIIKIMLGFIALYLLSRIFMKKNKSNQKSKALSQIPYLGYLFGIFYSIMALSFIYGVLLDYNSGNSLSYLLLIFILLNIFFALILIIYARKCQKFTKKLVMK